MTAEIKVIDKSEEIADSNEAHSDPETYLDQHGLPPNPIFRDAFHKHRIVLSRSDSHSG